MTKTKKVVRTIVVAGVLCSLAAIATFSAFSDQVDNPGNEVTAGTVTLADNDSGTALYNMTAAKPGQSSTPTCIKVDYTGSLAADVKFYSPSTIDTFGQHVTLRVEKGSQTGTPAAGSCTGFTGSGSDLFNDTLDNLPNSYAGGLVADGPTAATWGNGDSVAYRVTATLSNSTPDSAQGGTTNSHDLVWESRNQ